MIVAELITKTWAMHQGQNEILARAILMHSGELKMRRMSGSLLKLTEEEATAIVSISYNRLPKKDTKSGKVVVVPIMGTMSRYGDYCSLGSEDMASFIQEANADATVSAIVLEINSGGGEVDGTEMLGKVIRNSEKPVVAWVAGMAASAAYWVASQCAEIVCESETSSAVGSIGVLSMHVDSSKAYEETGHKITIVRSDGSEDKALYNSIEPLNEAVLAMIKSSLNVIKDNFVKTVKSGRPNIASDVFTGKMFHGTEAKKRGMIDRFGSLDVAISRADLIRRKEVSTNQTNNKMSFLSELFGGDTAQNESSVRRQIDAAVAVKDIRIQQLEAAHSEAVENAAIGFANAKADFDKQVAALTADFEVKLSQEKAHIYALEVQNSTISNELENYIKIGSASEFSQAKAWYETHKNEGRLAGEDASENGKIKKVSAVTQAAIDAQEKTKRVKK
jgi:protease IV